MMTREHSIGFFNPLDYACNQASGRSSAISNISAIKVRKEDIPRPGDICYDSEYESEDICQGLPKSPKTTTGRENAQQEEIKYNVRTFLIFRNLSVHSSL